MRHENLLRARNTHFCCIEKDIWSSMNVFDWKISIKASQESLVSHLEHQVLWYHTQCRKPDSTRYYILICFAFYYELEKDHMGNWLGLWVPRGIFPYRQWWQYQASMILYIGRNSRRIDLITHIVKVGINLSLSGQAQNHASKCSRPAKQIWVVVGLRFVAEMVATIDLDYQTFQFQWSW